MSTPSDLDRVERNEAKRPYASPKLVRYGDVRELTLAVKNAPQSEASFANGSLP